MIGYRQDHGIRECCGRSGSELGALTFREMFFEVQSDLASTLKNQNIKVYDLGDFNKYILSKFIENDK